MYEDDIQVAWEDEQGARITTLKNNDTKFHACMCMCEKCHEKENSIPEYGRKIVQV